ncbi:LysR substrate-binding domain-containing protein [Microbacterium sp. NPDC087591]|uniref:LysR substrate-binding domain-containing protein n=1 Tax=Microbacterium sp. NPDC087591 TaxID=3364192 RepID=UPI0037FF0B92
MSDVPIKPAPAMQNAAVRSREPETFRAKTGYRIAPAAVVTDTIGDIGKVVLATGPFDPATTTREFSVLISDAEAEVIVPPLLRRLRAASPSARLRVDAPTNVMHHGLHDELRRHDLIVLPSAAIPEHLPSSLLDTDEWACIVAADDDLEAGETVEQLRDRDWAVCWDLIDAPWTPGRLLEKAGFSDRLVVRTEGFLELFSIVTAAGLTALVPARLGEIKGPSHGIRTIPAPRDLAPPFGISAAWSPLFELDPAHQWFRAHVLEAARLEDGLLDA